MDTRKVYHITKEQYDRLQLKKEKLIREGQCNKFLNLNVTYHDVTGERGFLIKLIVIEDDKDSWMHRTSSGSRLKWPINAIPVI